jgi:hypothetical protein
MSIAAATDSPVLSSSGMIARNRGQGSQKQNSTVVIPPAGGLPPKPYCAHIPGSGDPGPEPRPARPPRSRCWTCRATV